MGRRYVRGLDSIVDLHSLVLVAVLPTPSVRTVTDGAVVSEHLMPIHRGGSRDRDPLDCLFWLIFFLGVGGKRAGRERQGHYEVFDQDFHFGILIPAVLKRRTIIRVPIVASVGKGFNGPNILIRAGILPPAGS